MKIMLTWKLLPGSVKAAAEHFLTEGANPEEGVTLLGRWYNADCRGGFTLYEASNAAALHLGVLKWADLLESTIVPVIEDGELGPNLVTVFRK